MTDSKITIAGVEYPVKPLVGRQLRFVMPALMRWHKAASDFTKMQPENYDDLYTIIYYGAIQPVNKDLTPGKLLDSEDITFGDLMHAVSVITKESGLFRNAKEGDISLGEA